MRSAAAATALGLTLTLGAALAACAPDDPVNPPTPSPSRTPVFASDEEALAAAEELYGKYLQAENALGAGGWQDISLVEPYVRGEALADEVDTAASFSSKGYRQVGEIVFDSTEIQHVEENGPGSLLVTIYLCLDVSSADIVDSTGESIVGPDRPDRLALEIDIDDVDTDLKISRSEPWPGDDFC
jgi:hypothetical protein